jgi:hypothetical protein
MVANMVIQGTNRSAQNPTNTNGMNILEELYKGSFGATEGAETVVDIIPVKWYRSIVFSTSASAWTTGTVLLKIYPCDAAGNVGANPFFTRTITANDASPVLLFLSEMGGAVTATPYPATAVATGSVIGPFGNWIKITEQMTAFTAGTNTVALKIEAKG